MKEKLESQVQGKKLKKERISYIAIKDLVPSNVIAAAVDDEPCVKDHNFKTKSN